VRQLPHLPQYGSYGLVYRSQTDYTIRTNDDQNIVNDRHNSLHPLL